MRASQPRAETEQSSLLPPLAARRAGADRGKSGPRPRGIGGDRSGAVKVSPRPFFLAFGSGRRERVFGTTRALGLLVAARWRRVHRRARTAIPQSQHDSAEHPATSARSIYESSVGRERKTSRGEAARALFQKAKGPQRSEQDLQSSVRASASCRTCAYPSRARSIPLMILRVGVMGI